MKNDCLVLIGMAGAGKSTLGKELAAALGFDFVDLDDCIREQESQSIQSIIDSRGEDALLRLEESVMYRIDLKRRVIAPGGSIIYNSNLMEYLKQHCFIVFLDEDFQTLEARLANAKSRGIVGLKWKTLKEIYDERRPLYLKYADLTISTRNKSKQEIIGEIVKQFLSTSN